MRIHEVAADRALLPVEEHVGVDAAVAGTRQTAVSQRLHRRPTGSRAWRARRSVVTCVYLLAVREVKERGRVVVTGARRHIIMMVIASVVNIVYPELPR